MAFWKALSGLVIGSSLATEALAQSLPSPPPPPRAPDDAIMSVRSDDADRLNRLVRERLARGFNAAGYKLAKDELRALRDFDTAVKSPDPGKGRMQLPKTAALIRSPDGKFIFGALQLELGTKTGDIAMQSSATDMVLESGLAPPSAAAVLYRNQASFALDAKDNVKAESAFGKLVELRPNDTDNLVYLGQVKSNLGKYGEALALFEKAIIQKAQAGQPIPEPWKRATQYARQQAQSGGTQPSK